MPPRYLSENQAAAFKASMQAMNAPNILISWSARAYTITFAYNITASAITRSDMGEAQRERVATLMWHALTTQWQHCDKSSTLLPNHVAGQMLAIHMASGKSHFAKVWDTMSAGSVCLIRKCYQQFQIK